MKTSFSTVTIIAPGLLGASLGAALHRNKLVDRVIVWARRAEVRSECARLEWCDETTETVEESVKDADLVVICAPVSKIPVLAHQIKDHLKPGTIVTDVGSTKHKLQIKSESALEGKGIFVGSHPMAGSEKSGHAHANETLFSGKPCFVTKGGQISKKAIEKVVGFWSALEMDVHVTDPEEHDQIVAFVSHLPHLTASGLSHVLSDPKYRHFTPFISTGFLDTTRVASGDLQMWRDIISENREEILPALNEMIQTMESLRDHLQHGQIDAVMGMLEEGKSFRDDLVK